MEQEEAVAQEMQGKEEINSKLEELQKLLRTIEEKNLLNKGESFEEKIEFYGQNSIDVSPLKELVEDFSDEEKVVYNDDIEKAEKILGVFDQTNSLVESCLDGAHYQKLVEVFEKIVELNIVFEGFEKILELIKTKEAFLEDVEEKIEIGFEELESDFQKWEKKEETENEKLSVLFSKNIQFFKNLIKVFPKINFSTTNVKEEEIKSWKEKLSSMNLNCPQIDKETEDYLTLREKLKRLLRMVERIKSEYSGPLLISKIIEEVTAWNKKKLKKEELPILIQLLDEFKELKKNPSKEDHMWKKLLNKLECYKWRQKVRQNYKTVDEQKGQDLLREAPIEMKISKCWEWNQLVERVDDVEWMDDKQIETKIVEFLDGDMDNTEQEDIKKFLNDSKICAVSEKTFKKIEVLETSSGILDDPSAEDIEKIIDLMIEAEFWNTKTFEKIDNINRTLKNISKISKEIEEIKQGNGDMVEELSENSIEAVFGQRRLPQSEVKDTVEKFKTLSHELTKDVALEYERIEAEIEKQEDLKKKFEPNMKIFEEELLESVTQENYAELVKEFNSILEDYKDSILKDQDLEQKLTDLHTLFEANRILLDNSKRESLKFWDRIANSISKKQKNVEEVKVYGLLQEKLTEAKDFLKIVHQIKHSTDSLNALTLEELETLVEKKRSEDMVITMDESLVYLDSIIARTHHYKNLLDLEKIKLLDIKEGIEFMNSISVNLEDLFKKFSKRKDRAETFASKIMVEKTRVIEKEFEKYAEEYNGLGIVIPNIEKQFTEMQECRNYNGEADRILADSSNSGEIQQLFDLREKMKKMRYFRSNNKLAKLTGKFFYCLREYYENSSSTKGEEEVIIEGRFVISFYKIRKLVKEAEHVGSKCKDAVKADLKQKTGFISQIIKDVSEHLSKNVYTLSVNEFKNKEPEKMYRGIINIEDSVLEFKKKLEEKEQEIMKAKENKKKSVHEKPTLSEKITGQARSFYIKNWTDSISKNRTFGKNPKEAKGIAKHLEKSIFSKNSENPDSYEKTCDEISRILKDICSYIYLSKDIKQKKFSLGAFRILFGKTAADIRRLNYMKKNDQKNKDRPLQSLGMKAKDVENSQDNDHKNFRQDQYGGRENFPEEISIDHTITTVEESSVVQNEFKYYRIYSGDVKIQNENNINLNLDTSQMFTCTKSSLLTLFGKIPESLSISTRIKKEGFEKYINRVMDSKNSKNYRIVVGWFDIPFGMNNLKNLLIERNCVASRQYSNSCKIFVFPKEYIISSWIRKQDFLVVGPNHDIMFMLVLKNSMVDEVKIDPEPMDILAKKAFKLRFFEGRVRERPISMDCLREENFSNLRKHEDKMLKKRKMKKGHREYKKKRNMRQMKGGKSNVDLIKNAQAGVEKILQKYSQAERNPITQKPQRNFMTNLARSNFNNSLSTKELLKSESRGKNYINYRNDFINSKGYNPPMSRQEKFYRSRENSAEINMDQNNYKQDLLGTLQSVNQKKHPNYRKHRNHRKKFGPKKKSENGQKYFNRSSNIYFKKHPTALEESLRRKPKTHSQEKKHSFLQNAINSIQVSGGNYNPGRLASLVRDGSKAPKEVKKSLTSLANPYNRKLGDKNSLGNLRGNKGNSGIFFDRSNEINFRNLGESKGGYFFN